MFSEELWILARPMSRNSVIEEFSARRFAVVQGEIRVREILKVISTGVAVRWVGSIRRAHLHSLLFRIQH